MAEPDVPDLPFEEACKQLTAWTQGLLYEVEHSIPEIQNILATTNGGTSPTRQQQALLVYRGIKEKLSEVECFVEMVERVIRESAKS